MDTSDASNYFHLPTLHILCKRNPAAARVGINPTPTVIECCDHFDNPLIAKVLHTSAVGAGFIPALPIADKIQSKKTAAAGFIPVLPTEDKIQSKYPAAARVGITSVHLNPLTFA